MAVEGSMVRIDGLVAIPWVWAELDGNAQNGRDGNATTKSGSTLEGP